jgi:hypothetical protein
MRLSGGKHERVREPERVVLGAKPRGPLGDRGGQRDDGNSHAGDRVPCVLDASGRAKAIRASL